MQLLAQHVNYYNQNSPDFRETVVLWSHCIGYSTLIGYCSDDNSN